MHNFLKTLVGVIMIAPCAFPQDENSSIDEGNLLGSTYTSREIGWSTKIPEGWSVVSRDLMESNMQKGKEAIEEVQGGVDYRGLKYL